MWMDSLGTQTKKADRLAHGAGWRDGVLQGSAPAPPAPPTTVLPPAAPWGTRWRQHPGFVGARRLRTAAAARGRTPLAGCNEVI